MRRQCDYFCRWNLNIGTLGQVGCLCGTRGDNTNISDEVLKPDWAKTIKGRGFDRFDSLLCPEPIVAFFAIANIEFGLDFCKLKKLFPSLNVTKQMFSEGDFLRI